MDLETLAAAWRERLTRQEAQRRQRAEAARAAARRAATLLCREFDVDAVWLFGSLVAGPRHDDFDIDLAVRGLLPQRYWTALARVSDIVGESVDMVPFESCNETLRRRLETTAERLDD